MNLNGATVEILRSAELHLLNRRGSRPAGKINAPLSPALDYRLTQDLQIADDRTRGVVCDCNNGADSMKTSGWWRSNDCAVSFAHKGDY